MKGKKFDAAEKHFKIKEESYNKRIKNLERLLIEKKESEKSLLTEVESLRIQNENLKTINKKLTELCNLSEEEDIQASILKDKQMAEAAWAVARIMGGI